MPKMTGKRSFLFLLTIGFLCSLVYASVAQAAEILREAVPLERNHVALHLERYIEQDGQSKKPILFVHGVTFSSHEFDVNYKDYSLARYFAKHGYEVWLLDIAGFGHSEAVKDGFMPDSDYAAEDIEAAVRCILARNNLSSMDVLGWSWGTVTSGRFAARHPELVHRLVLYAPIFVGMGEKAVKEPFHHNTWGSAASDFQRKADGSIDFDIAEELLVNTYIANAWHYDRDSSPNGGRRDLLVSDNVRLIPMESINVPVLIIAGSKDQYASPALCKEAFAMLSNRDKSQLVIIDGGGHAMVMERPYYKKFRENVLRFLRAN